MLNSRSATALPLALLLGLAGAGSAFGQASPPVQPMTLETAQSARAASGENGGPDIGLEGGPRLAPRCVPQFGDAIRQVGPATDNPEQDTLAYPTIGERCEHPR